MQQDDNPLVLNYISGDENALTEIINRYLKPIYNFSLRIILNPSESEDVTQEVFLKVWKNIKKFDQSKNFKTWIFAIAHNTCLDYLRKRKNIPISDFDNAEGENFLENKLIDPEPLAPEMLNRAQNAEAVNKAVTQLTQDQRIVISLRYESENTFDEISKILNKPIDTVKSHHLRAIRKLREILKEIE